MVDENIAFGPIVVELRAEPGDELLSDVRGPARRMDVELCVVDIPRPVFILCPDPDSLGQLRKVNVGFLLAQIWFLPNVPQNASLISPVDADNRIHTLVGLGFNLSLE